MIRQWQINKLKIKIARKSAQANELSKIVHSGATIPLYYADNLITLYGKIAALTEKLSLLQKEVEK